MRKRTILVKMRKMKIVLKTMTRADFEKSKGSDDDKDNVY